MAGVPLGRKLRLRIPLRALLCFRLETTGQSKLPWCFPLALTSFRPPISKTARRYRHQAEAEAGTVGTYWPGHTDPQILLYPESPIPLNEGM